MTIVKKTKVGTSTYSYLSKNIKLLLEHHNLSISELARGTGLAKTTLFSLINDASPDPRIQTLMPISEFFNKPIEELISNKMALVPAINNEKKIPIIEWDDIKKYLSSEDIRCDFFTIETTASNKSFILKTSKSLRPRFIDNTLLIFDPIKKYNDGDIVLIEDMDNNFIIKELYYDGTKIYMMPINPDQIEKPRYHSNEYQIIAVLTSSVFTY